MKRFFFYAWCIAFLCASVLFPAANAEAAQVKDTLTIAMMSEPASMSTVNNEAMDPIYSGYLTHNFLMKNDPKTLEPIPDLAQSYELVSDTEYIFKLRKGVKFHHGKEFKAEDVVATINYNKTFPGCKPYVGAIKKVEAIDDYTVKFIMDKPYPNLLNDLTFKVNFIQAADLIAKGHNFDNEPIGTGPFRLVEWKRGSTIRYERFGDYFNKDEVTNIKTIIWKVIPEGTSRTIALEAGEVDMVFQVETADIERLKKNEKVSVEEIVEVANYAMGINNDLPPFNDVNLRQAIAHAIDRKAIVIGALNGYGIPNFTSCAQNYWGSTTEGACTFDPIKAKEYLKKWGGDPSTVKLSIICWNPMLVRVGTIVQGSLEEILGIKVELEEVDSATFSSRRASGQYRAFFTYWSPSNSFSYVTRYHSDKRSSVPGACNDAKVDEYVDALRNTVAAEKRLELTHKIIARVNEIAAQPSLFQTYTFRAYNKNLAGAKFTPHGYAYFHTCYWK